MAAAVEPGSSKTGTTQTPYIKRLYQDLKQLKEEPIVGANAEPLEHDMLTWYGIVLGAEGTDYAGIPIRFCLKFTDEYPNEPPSAYFETHIKYYGGSSYKDESGRTVVCLNIFGNFGHRYTHGATESEGWSPSYTVQTILVSMQALFLSDMLTTDKETIALTRKSAMEFMCPKTGHNGSIRSSWFPKIITDYNIAAAIAASSGRVGYNVLRDFYVCYVKKTTAEDPEKLGTTLGYGIHAEKNGTLSSPCEYISHAAFMEGTRRSATNRPFENWVPILINTPYAGKFMEQLNQALTNIFSSRDCRDSPPYVKLFKLCSSVMNNLVVEIMNNAGNITANDKFINGYIAFYRLLVSYAEMDPELTQYANKAIGTFLSDPKNRVKSAVSNLGELLIYLTISTEYAWTDLAEAFMEECDTRNVRWYLSSNPALNNEAALHGRSEKVFRVTSVSRNLVMYQVKFCKMVKSLSPSILETNFGLAPDEMRFELKDIYNMVQTIDSYDGFFDWIDMPRVPENVRDQQLIDAMKRSEKQGYHGGNARGGRNRY